MVPDCQGHVDDPRISLCASRHLILCSYFPTGMTALIHANGTGHQKIMLGPVSLFISELDSECCKYLYFFSKPLMERTPTPSGIKNYLHQELSKLHFQHSQTQTVKDFEWFLTARKCYSAHIGEVIPSPIVPDSGFLSSPIAGYCFNFYAQLYI